MATQTTNLNLTLPDGTDQVDISVLNENFQKIDSDFPFRLGVDENGNYGYYKAGADTLTPFNSGDLVPITPDFFGLAYGYLTMWGVFYSSTEATNCMSCFHVTTGRYVVFLDTPVSSRFRSSYFQNKDLSDFLTYLTASRNLTSENIYSGTRILPTNDTEIQGSALEQRYVVDISGEGELLVGSSNESKTVKVFLFRYKE